MFKKVVSSVKTAWNNAVEEFEQHSQESRNSGSSLSFYNHSNLSHGSLLNEHAGNGPNASVQRKSSIFFMSRKRGQKNYDASEGSRPGSAADMTRTSAYNDRNHIIQPKHDERYPLRGSAIDTSHDMDVTRQISGVKRKASTHITHFDQTPESNDYEEATTAGMQNLNIIGKNQAQHLPQNPAASKPKRRKFFTSMSNSLDLRNLSRSHRHSNTNSVSSINFTNPDNHTLNSHEAQEYETPGTEAEVATASDDLHGQDTPENIIKYQNIRIHELETLVAQKDNIIRILRDEIQRPSSKSSLRSVENKIESQEYDEYATEDEHDDSDILLTHEPGTISSQTSSHKPALEVDISNQPFSVESINDELSKNSITLKPNSSTMLSKPPLDSPQSEHSTDSSVSSSLFTMLPTIAPSRANNLGRRPISITHEADVQFDNVIDQQYYNHPNQSFEVLSPIAIDMERFISTNDPMTQQKRN